MNRFFFAAITIVLFVINVQAQDTLYIYKTGLVVSKYSVNQIDSMNFTPPKTGTVADIDGNVYHWITIGSQKWLVENLKTTRYCNGESISNVTDVTSWTNSNFAAWCDYDNSASNGTKYGHLYNWYAVFDTRKIAPSGCHVASDADWTTLQNYLISNGFNYDGITTGNKIGKSLASTSDWRTCTVIGAVGNDLTKNNKSGFTALSAGYRWSDGTFTTIGDYSTWWSTTESSTTYAWGRFLNYDFYYLNRDQCKKNYGFSVRCLKD